MGIEHIALYTAQLEAARTFFVRYFGAVSNEGYHNPRTDFRSYFLSFGDGTRLELMTRPELTRTERCPDPLGYAHLAFSVGSREAVDALTERLAQDGYRVTSGPRITGDGYYESCVEVFEGNLIEITV